MAPLRLQIDGSTFRDSYNREVTLHGINVAGDAKLPAHPETSSHVREHFFDGDNVSFVDRPFSVSEAHTHFARLKSWGFNCIRYVYTWEAIEHQGPGKYDEEFIDHTINVLQIAREYGFYVFMDPHQDVWSRFTGGSGAPMWTIYACGFDPKTLAATEAALVQNTWQDPAEFPRMVWATNYTRLACQTITTMFFAGRDFTPKCVIDSKNIQDYLQDHFIGACQYLARRIHAVKELHGVVVGFESMNEPNRGYVGHPDLTKLPEEQRLRRETTPTAWQAILTGAGRAVEVDTWDFGTFGPYKSGTKLVDPEGVTAWLDPPTWNDKTYGWTRAESWRLGECIWAQHGVWEPRSDDLKLPQYFSKHPRTGEKVDMEYWTNHYFLNHYRQYKHAIREVWPETIMFMQPSPYEVPPRIKDTADDDKNTVFSSHFYDGITLITKKWNRLFNVDVIGVLRGKYSSPVFAVKFGETAIRNCFKDQLSVLRQEGIDLMGNRPSMFTEIGIPYDMDNSQAYQSGDYSSQIAAIDANCFAVEGCKAQGFTWWVYTAANNHFWGDNWNGEDLSIYCKEDRTLPQAYTDNSSKVSLDPSSPSYSESQTGSQSTIRPDTLKKTLSVSEMSPVLERSSTNTGSAPGFRAAEAYIRPTPVYTYGTIESYGLDLRNCTFTLTLNSPTSTPPDTPTEIFLPSFHFPQQLTSIEVSGGKWEIRIDEFAAGASQQILRWWHGEGEQKLTAKGVKRKNGALQSAEQEESYLEAYWQMSKNCTIM